MNPVNTVLVCIIGFRLPVGKQLDNFIPIILVYTKYSQVWKTVHFKIQFEILHTKANLSCVPLSYDLTVMCSSCDTHRIVHESLEAKHTDVHVRNFRLLAGRRGGCGRSVGKHTVKTMSTFQIQLLGSVKL